MMKGQSVLVVQVVLDEPTKTHPGPGSVVTGKVVLQYINPKQLPRHAPSRELFGPAMVKIKFTGSIYTDPGHILPLKPAALFGVSSTQTLSLFEQTHILLDGPLRVVLDEPLGILFAVTFPHICSPEVDAVSPTTASGNSRKSIIETAPIEGPLPPSCCALLSPLIVESHFIPSINISYHIKAEVQTPGIDVSVLMLGMPSGPEIRYSPTKLITEFHGAWDNKITKQLIANDKPSDQEGIISGQGPRALLRHSSSLAKGFEVMCCLPSHLRVGEPVVFEISLQPNERGEVDAMSDIWLADNFTVLLVSDTIVASKGQSLETDSRKPRKNEMLFHLGTIMGLGRNFEEANGFKKVLETRPLGWLAPSFTFHNVARSYALRLRFHIVVGSRKLEVRGECPVVLHPPREDLFVEDIPPPAYCP